MDHLLMYETDWEDHYDNYLVPLVNHEIYHCEEDGCDEKATIEWMCRDEDGQVYYSMKCDSHPVKNDYEPREL